jgi:hypothetical protein
MAAPWQEELVEKDTRMRLLQIEDPAHIQLPDAEFPALHPH